MTPLALLFLGVAVAGGALTLDRIANAVIRPVPHGADLSAGTAGLEHEEFTIGTGEQALAALLLRGASPNAGGPLLLIAHGWGASSATVLQLAEPLAKKGHDTLLFDMRGHGRNKAAPFVTVRNLRDDVLAAVRYAEARFAGREIVLVGHSFGGAASVLAAAEGARVTGLVLIATPSDVVRITAEFLSDKGVPGRLAVTVLRPFWWWRIGGTFRPHSPERRIRELTLPILIIQPELDQRVHRRHAERLSEAAGVPFHIVPGREHTDVLVDPMTVRLVEEFVERLAATPGTPESASFPAA
ncbi:MAG: alpha/beta hydrolase [Gemmatimonadales bacterium]